MNLFLAFSDRMWNFLLFFCSDQRLSSRINLIFDSNIRTKQTIGFPLDSFLLEGFFQFSAFLSVRFDNKKSKEKNQFSFDCRPENFNDSFHNSGHKVCRWDDIYSLRLCLHGQPVPNEVLESATEKDPTEIFRSIKSKKNQHKSRVCIEDTESNHSRRFSVSEFCSQDWKKFFYDENQFDHREKSFVLTNTWFLSC